MENKKTYAIKIIADGIIHHQIISDKSDLEILLSVFKKIERDATNSVPQLEEGSK